MVSDEMASATEVATALTGLVSSLLALHEPSYAGAVANRHHFSSILLPSQARKPGKLMESQI